MENEENMAPMGGPSGGLDFGQSPFGRLLDLPGIDGPQDIFGGLSQGGEGGNPFAGGGDPDASGNPFAGGFGGGAGGNPFAGGGGGNPFGGGSDGGDAGGNPFGGGSDGGDAGGNPFGGGGNPFAGGGGGFGGGAGGNPFGGGSDGGDAGGSPFGGGGGNPFAGGGGGFGGGAGGNPFGGGSDGGDAGGNPFAGGGNPFGGGMPGGGDGEGGDQGGDERPDRPADDNYQWDFGAFGDGDDRYVWDFSAFDDPDMGGDRPDMPDMGGGDMPDMPDMGGDRPDMGGGEPDAGGDPDRGDGEGDVSVQVVGQPAPGEGEVAITGGPDGAEPSDGGDRGDGRPSEYDFSGLDSDAFIFAEHGDRVVVDGGNNKFVVEVRGEGDDGQMGGSTVVVEGGNNQFVIIFDYGGESGLEVMDGGGNPFAGGFGAVEGQNNQGVTFGEPDPNADPAAGIFERGSAPPLDDPDYVGGDAYVGDGPMPGLPPIDLL